MNEQYVLMLWLLAMLCSLVGGFDRLNSARRRESRSKIRGSKSNEKEIERKRERRKEGRKEKEETILNFLRFKIALLQRNICRNSGCKCLRCVLEFGSLALVSQKSRMWCKFQLT